MLTTPASFAQALSFTRFCFISTTLLGLLLPVQSIAQSLGHLSGTVRNAQGEGIPYSSVSIVGTSIGVASDNEGHYRLMVPTLDSLTIEMGSIGYASRTYRILMHPGETRVLDGVLSELASELEGVSVLAAQRRFGNIERIEHRDIGFLPDVSGSFESILKSLPGVSSSNELSSQYSVRGGNFDENLVYVNDIEIYRPFLIRSGQQEGLSFVNPDLVEGVEFSAGGFNAEFGDKMSSVLNIRYRQPQSNSARAELSLLGANGMVEGVSQNGQFTHLTGIRYKTNQYMLGSLDEKGEYRPSFIDLQSNLTWRLAPSLTLGLLGGYSSNRYWFIPRVRETRFGMFRNSLQLKVYYDGQEVNRFETLQGALTADYKPTNSVNLKLIGSAFAVREAETFDILGQYLLNELDNTLGSETYGDSTLNVGIGGFLNHARNYLDGNILRVEHLGSHITSTNKLKWGARMQFEHIEDRISEWELIDSSGYNIPYHGDQIVMSYWLRSANQMASFRYSGYVQNGFSFELGNWGVTTTAGVRLSYWTFNKQLTFSPRASVTLTPDWTQTMSFHLSGGYYHQPPIYRELRLPTGLLNPNIRAQEAIHLVAGVEYFFNAWGRPFRVQTEIYQKFLNHLIPYKVDNVRIKYAGENLSNGYARGVDFKINGEFVDGAESWASFSIMESFEDIEGDYFIDTLGNTVYPGYFPRPTDQRYNIGLFFQDYLPGLPTFKVHLSGHYGSRLPVGIPGWDRYDVQTRLPSYKRVDMGFSKIFKDERVKGGRWIGEAKWLKGLWLGVEVFNLFDINNTVSYLWVQTLNNQSGEAGLYAVPNYLTSRRINLKLTARF